jgi:hypothetical protein
MKWIKLFEGYLDEYYQKITFRDFEVYQYGKDNSVNNRVDFDKKIMINVGSLFTEGFKFGTLYIGSQPTRERYGSIYGMTINGNRESILIIQLEDEWFLVRQQVEDIMSGPYNESYNYYRCDQVEGLKKLLKDKGIIK